MLISCKLSNTVLAYFDLVGLDPSELWAQHSIPEEYLRDASNWLTFAEMEDFLKMASLVMEAHPHQALGLEMIAEKVRELRSWGLLDHVLRILNQSNEPMANPQRFLSYFVQTEEEGLCLLTGEPGTTACEFSIRAEDFPMTASLLCASLRSLSLFFSGISAEAEWSQYRLIWKMKPSENKQNLPESPRVPQTIDLTELAQQLEEAHSALQKQKTKRRTQKEESAQELLPGFEFERRVEQVSIETMDQGFTYLKDFFLKAGQLTRLIAASESQKQNKQIIKNLDWEFAFGRASEVLKELINLENHRQKGLKNGQNRNHQSP